MSVCFHQKFEMKHHPEVLMLMLKRFKFDYSYMKYVKMNQSVRIPYKLQIPPTGAQVPYSEYLFKNVVSSYSCCWLLHFLSSLVSESDLWAVCICGTCWWTEIWSLHCNNQVPGWWEVVPLQWQWSQIGMLLLMLLFERCQCFITTKYIHH